MTQLFWQPTAVRNCFECHYKHFDLQNKSYGCDMAVHTNNEFEIYRQNKNGITPTCPMWIEQNKETTNANT